MNDRFGLVLMLNHACNLRCTYCYNGAAFHRPMPDAIGLKALQRAAASCEPGGTLELGFFGGEPLLEAERALRLIECARDLCRERALALSISVTTNGTLAEGPAWTLMMLSDLDLCISCDGLPRVHDRHRRFADGRGTAAVILRTLDRLRRAGKSFRVVPVVRPDTVRLLPEGLEFLYTLGVRRVDPSLDLWAQWTAEDMPVLDGALARCAEFWRARFPELGFSWFDDKAARILRVPLSRCARCGFGAGEVAVAPSGALYPCERLIGADAPANPSRLPGDAAVGDDFLHLPVVPPRSAPACMDCAIRDLCDTFCRCSNFVRSGDVSRPDGLLCHLNRVCARETARALRTLTNGLTRSRKDAKDGERSPERNILALDVPSVCSQSV